MPLSHQIGASVSDAARIPGVHRTTPYFWRDQDPEFAQTWRDSHDKLVEGLEMEAFQRAAKGSDRLLIFLLKSYKPETYNESFLSKSPSASQCLTLAELTDKVRQWT